MKLNVSHALRLQTQTDLEFEFHQVKKMITSVEDTSKFSIEKLTPSNRDTELLAAASRAFEKADFANKKFLSIKHFAGKEREDVIQASCIAAGNTFLDLGFLTGCAIVVGELASKPYKEMLSDATEKAMKVPRAIDGNMTGRMKQFLEDDPAVNFPNWKRVEGRPTPTWADHASRQQLCQIMFDRMVELMKSTGEFRKAGESVSPEKAKDCFYDYLSLKFLVGVVSGLIFCRPEDFEKVAVYKKNGERVDFNVVLGQVTKVLARDQVDLLMAEVLAKKFPAKK